MIALTSQALAGTSDQNKQVEEVLLNCPSGETKSRPKYIFGHLDAMGWMVESRFSPSPKHL